MKFDVVIPTRAIANEVLGATLSSLAMQTIPPHYIFLVCDRHFTSGELTDFAHWVENYFVETPAIHVRLLTHLSDDLRVWEQNGSYLRNYGLRKVESECCLLLDDDNTFAADFCERMTAEFQQASELYAAEHGRADVLYSPAIWWRTTNIIQSYGLRDFHYFLSWPEPMQGGWKAKCFASVRNIWRRDKQENASFYYPHMIGGNSLFWSTAAIRDLGFDEEIAFVAEDIDFSYRRWKNRGPIVVSKTLVIHHMERDKTPAERSFLADPRTAYQKWRNRFLFVKKNASRSERIWFLACGAWIQTLWMIMKIIGGDYGSMKQKRNVLWGYIQGTWVGMQSMP